MDIIVQQWKDADGPLWSQYEFMSDLYQVTWMETTEDALYFWI